MSLDKYLAQVVASVANRVLQAEPWATAQLRPHAGERFNIYCIPVFLEFWIDQQGLLCAEQTDEAENKASVTVTLTPAALLSTGTQRLKHIKIEGDAALAHALGEMAQKVRPDFEQALASLVGNIAAKRIHQMIRVTLESLREQAKRVAANLVEFAVYENPVIVGTPLFEELGHQNRLLRDQIERLSKRIELLERI